MRPHAGPLAGHTGVMNDAYIGLGSNMGAPVANLRSAALALDALPGTDVVSLSHVYESEPWGVTEQPPFANAVACVRTSLRADQMLEYLGDIEEELGRRPGPRYGPRTIDLDLLLFGDEEWHTDDLVVPHPRMAERDFVLTPLLAIAPDVRWPDGSPVRRGGRLEGRVVGDHGRVPDTDPDWHVWEAREALLETPGRDADDQPPPWDTADEWVEVAKGAARGGEIDVLESKLRGAGIPYELSHRELGDAIGTLQGPARIMVPRSRLEEARLALGVTGVRWEAVREEPYPRPAWFRGTLRVFGWMFALYWIVRILARDWG